MSVGQCRQVGTRFWSFKVGKTQNMAFSFFCDGKKLKMPYFESFLPKSPKPRPYLSTLSNRHKDFVLSKKLHLWKGA